MNKYFKESILWILILLPLVYLSTLWNDLPEQIPTHFDLSGNPNGWSDKNELIFLLASLGIGTYLLMLFIPRFDPKKKIQQMGDKYYSLRLLMTFFMTLISIYILYTGNGNKLNPGYLIGLIGAFDTVFGNYLQTVKPNYFIGFRTPWTLENEQTWRNTHRLAGRMWMLGGLLIVLMSFALSSNFTLGILFAIITLIIVLVPIIYSYTQFKKLHA
ncbi:MAG: SdpI family protein [Paludibacter sp.]|nr:SdpI family protein [Paludibacter sp.]